MASVFSYLHADKQNPLSCCSLSVLILSEKSYPETPTQKLPHPDLLVFSAACRGCVTLAERITSEHLSRWGGVRCFVNSILSIASRFIPVALSLVFGIWSRTKLLGDLSLYERTLLSALSLLHDNLLLGSHTSHSRTVFTARVAFLR